MVRLPEAADRHFFDQYPEQPIPEQIQPSTDEIALVRSFRRLPPRLQRTLSELAEVMAEDA